MNTIEQLDAELQSLEYEVNKKYPNLKEDLKQFSQLILQSRHWISNHKAHINSPRNKHRIQIECPSTIYQALNIICDLKLPKLCTTCISIIQKLQNARMIQSVNMTANMSSLVNFISKYKQVVVDEKVQIKLVSTTIILINQDTIDGSNYVEFMEIFKLLLAFYNSQNTIISNSSVSGIAQLFDVFQKNYHLQQNSEKYYSKMSTGQDITLGILSLLKGVNTPEIPLDHRSIKSKLICEDILIMLMSTLINRQISPLENTIKAFLVTQLKAADQDTVQVVRNIRLMFQFIKITQSNFDLLLEIRNSIYQMPGASLVYYEGICQFLSKTSFFSKMIVDSKQNNYHGSYYQFAMRVLNESLESHLKRKIQFNKQTLLKPLKFVWNPITDFKDLQQLDQPIGLSQILNQVHSVLDNQYFVLETICLDPFEHFDSVDAQAIINEKRSIQTQSDESNEINSPNSSPTEFEDNPDSSQKNLSLLKHIKISIIEKVQVQFIKNLKTIYKLICQGGQADTKIIELFVELLKHSINFSFSQGYFQGVQQLMRVMSMYATPLKINHDTEKWLLPYQQMMPMIQKYKHILTPKCWNSILHCFQRIQQLVLKKEPKFRENLTPIVNLFKEVNKMNSNCFVNLVDALCQLSLQVIEKIQLNDVNYFEINYKFFGLERIEEAIDTNWERVHLVWPIVEAHLICIISSRIQEMRMHALRVLKNLLLGGLSYFLQIDLDDIPLKMWRKQSDVRQKTFELKLQPVQDSSNMEKFLTPPQQTSNINWIFQWGNQLFNPLFELSNSKFEDVRVGIIDIVEEIVSNYESHLKGDILYLLFGVMESIYKSESRNNIELILNIFSRLSLIELDSLTDQQLLKIKGFLSQLPICNDLINMKTAVINQTMHCDLQEDEFQNLFNSIKNGLLSSVDEEQKNSMHNLRRVIETAIKRDLRMQKETQVFQPSENILKIRNMFFEIANMMISYYKQFEVQNKLFIPQTPRITSTPETPKFNRYSTDDSTYINNALVNQQLKQWEYIVGNIVSIVMIFHRSNSENQMFQLFCDLLNISNFEVKVDVINQFSYDSKHFFKIIVQENPENINRILNYMESLMSQDDEVIDKQYILYKLANPFNDYIQILLIVSSTLEDINWFKLIVTFYSQFVNQIQLNEIEINITNQVLDLTNQFCKCRIQVQQIWMEFLSSALKSSTDIVGFSLHFVDAWKTIYDSIKFQETQLEFKTQVELQVQAALYILNSREDDEEFPFFDRMNLLDLLWNMLDYIEKASCKLFGQFEDQVYQLTLRSLDMFTQNYLQRQTDEIFSYIVRILDKIQLRSPEKKYYFYDIMVQMILINDIEVKQRLVLIFQSFKDLMPQKQKQ